MKKMKAEKKVSPNPVISEDEVSDLKILEGLPPITLNVKNLHIHLDERMFSHSEFGKAEDDEAELAESIGFNDCGLDCDGHCESCEFCGKGDDEDEPFEDDSDDDDDDDDEDDEETPINDLIETLHTQTGI